MLGLFTKWYLIFISITIPNLLYTGIVIYPYVCLIIENYMFWIIGIIQSCSFFSNFNSSFSYLFYARLGYVRVEEYLTGLESSVGARNKRKATVKI